MEEETLLSPRQVGQRIRARRMELHLSMPELGRRLGVNKSTVQRYEADGVNPGRSMVIGALARALQTSPEWLTGRADAPPAGADGCPDGPEAALAHCEEIIRTLSDPDRCGLLLGMLEEMLATYGVVCAHFARAMDRADRLDRDDGLRRSLDRYAIDAGELTEKTYRKEMQPPLEELKNLLDCLLDACREDPRQLLAQARQIRQQAEEHFRDGGSEAAPTPSPNQRSLHDATL